MNTFETDLNKIVVSLPTCLQITGRPINPNRQIPALPPIQWTLSLPALAPSERSPEKSGEASSIKQETTSRTSSPKTHNPPANKNSSSSDVNNSTFSELMSPIVKIWDKVLSTTKRPTSGTDSNSEPVTKTPRLQTNWLDETRYLYNELHGKESGMLPPLPASTIPPNLATRLPILSVVHMADELCRLCVGSPALYGYDQFILRPNVRFSFRVHWQVNSVDLFDSRANSNTCALIDGKCSDSIEHHNEQLIHTLAEEYHEAAFATAVERNKFRRSW